MPYEKVGKNEPVCIAEEVPFDIPDSWEWVRLGNFCDMYTGDSINETEKKLKFTNIPNGRYYIGTKDVGFDYIINYDNGVKIPEEYTKFRVAPVQSVLLCIEGGSAGRKIAITNQEVCFGNKLCCFNPFSDSNGKFLYYYLQSPAFTSIFKDKITGIIGGVSINTLKELYVALPPLNEQQRIVDKIKELEPYINDYDKAYEKIEKLNTDFSDLLKKSILQEAVQGKLVDQDPNDEPASVLIEQIRKEKEQLIKDKKIKKDKNESYIFRRDNSHYEKIGTEERCIDDEIPFDIPASWEWTRLGNVINLTSGQDLTPDMYNAKQKGIPYITGASNIEDGKIIINRWTDKGRAFAYRGDLLLTCKGTVGTMAFLTEEKAHIARQIMGISTYKQINIDYVKIFLESYINILKAKAKSMIPGISRDDVLNILFPSPPLSEQQRIVDKVNQLLPQISKL